MTVAQSDRYNLYTTTGGETVFVYDFTIYDQNDIQIKRYRGGVDTILTLTTDYTVTGVNNVGGGTVVLTAVALANDVYAVYGINEYTNVNFTSGGGYSASAFNLGFNQEMNVIQQVRRDTDRCFHLPITEIAVNTELPHVAGRANKLFGFDTQGAPAMYALGSGGGSASLTEKFIIQTADVDLPNAQDLASLTTGIMYTTTATGVVGTIALTDTPNEITITNPTGAGGNPKFSLPTNLTFTSKIITGGTYNSSIINVNDSDFTVRDDGDNTKTMKFQLSGITTGNLRTITVPDSSGTMLTTSFCTVPDNVFRLTDNGDATKIAVFEASGITTATTRTYTLPNASGTIALTNTPFTDANFSIVDDGDATKILKFECSGITTGNTRTMTIPNASGTLLTTATANISDSILRIQDNGDATKQLAFECSGITTATTRTITIPDTNGTMLTTGTANVSDSVLRIQDNGDATKQLAFECSGITTGNTRTITIPNSNGTMLTTGTAAVPDNVFTLQDDGDATKQAVFQCSTIGTGTTRTFTFPNASGTISLSTDIPAAAAQSDQETATSITTFVSPGRQQFHPCANKFWCLANGAGTSILASYNVTSLTDSGTGLLTVNFTTSFSSTSYTTFVTIHDSAARIGTKTSAGTGSVVVSCYSTTFANVDPATAYNIVGQGDQ